MLVLVLCFCVWLVPLRLLPDLVSAVAALKPKGGGGVSCRTSQVKAPLIDWSWLPP